MKIVLCVDSKFSIIDIFLAEPLREHLQKSRFVHGLYSAPNAMDVICSCMHTLWRFMRALIDLIV